MACHTMKAAREFARHFNSRSTAGIAALIAEDATAEVIGSGLPVEEGRQKILLTSIPYMMGEQCGTPDAEAVEWRGEPHVVLRAPGADGALVILIAVHTTGGMITRLDYHAAGAGSEVLRDHATETGQRISTG